MFKNLYHKEKGARGFNDYDRQVLLETLDWYDNPEFKPNAYQKKFLALMDKKKKLDKDKASEHDNKDSKRRSKKSV